MRFFGLIFAVVCMIALASTALASQGNDHNQGNDHHDCPYTTTYYKFKTKTYYETKYKTEWHTKYEPTTYTYTTWHTKTKSYPYTTTSTYTYCPPHYTPLTATDGAMPTDGPQA